jgi:hypothetical protein
MSDGVHRGHGSGARRTGARQVASFVAAAGVMLAVLLGPVLSAGAATGQLPTQQQGEQAAVRESGATQAIVVGGFAFVLMVGAAGGVLWFTARSRNHH